MRFVVDADLPRSLTQLLKSYKHDGFHVRDIGLGDAEDTLIASRAKSDGLCLLSGDFGFADVRNYPPQEYAGIVVLELPKDATAKTIMGIVHGLLKRNDVVQKLPGRLAIVSVGRVRLRPK